MQPRDEAATEEQLVRRALAELPDVSVLIFDLDMRFRAVIGAAIGRQGYDAERMLGLRPADVLPADGWSTLRAGYEAALRGEKRTITHGTVDGSAFYEATFCAVREDGEVIAGMVTIRDVTVQQRAATVLARSEELFRVLTESSTDVVARTDTSGVFTYVSPAAEAVLGWRPDLMVGRSVFAFVHPDDRCGLQDAFGRLLDGAHDMTAEFRFECSNGRFVWVETRGSALRDDSGRVSAVQGSFRDVQDRRRHEEELRHRATHDGLTGLWNRHRLHEELARCHEEAARYDHRSPALLVVDLDGFKAVNDAEGHHAGDRHLVAVAAALRRATRDSDRCARVGGDEFAVLLPDGTPGEASALGRRIVNAVAALGPTRASVGIAALRHGAGVEDWMRRADRAMYNAKRAGGHRVVADHATSAG